MSASAPSIERDRDSGVLPVLRMTSSESADDLSNHVRLREDARRNRAIGRRQFQQADFGRTQRRRRVALQSASARRDCVPSAGRRRSPSVP